MRKTEFNPVQLVNEPEVPKGGFQICKKHHLRMLKLLNEFGVKPEHIAQTEAEVNALLSTGKSDPILDVSRVLFSLAVNSIGAKDLAVFQCPVCAFRKFDFLAKISGIVALKYQQQTAVFMPKDRNQLITPS